uniref:B-cell receptor CD22 n=1 Tax=Seriola lalandi dorsalis TaxID=1841481 RepID=A0A3B4XXE1_SERLL
MRISLLYSHPSRLNDADTAVEETFWFTIFSDNEPVDLRADSEYSGRVQYHCGENDCTLRITDLRESDSAEYKFRFITNQPGGKYTGEPGVTLSVTGNVFNISLVPNFQDQGNSTCHSSCRLPDHSSYIWYQNGQKSWTETPFFSVYVHSADRKNQPPLLTVLLHPSNILMFSPPDVLKVPSVSVNPPGEIMEGGSVTLTCNSNSAANYTWYKKNLPLPNKEPQLVFNSIQSSDSGQYYCAAENELGRRTSDHKFIDVECESKLMKIQSLAVFMFKSIKTLKCYKSSCHNQLMSNHLLQIFSDNEPVDLRADSEYSGRVQYHCGENDCTLRITDLRESDSADYKFRFITNQPGGKYTGEPGVTLSVTGNISVGNYIS